MKIEILRPVMISGEPAAAGSILEVDDSDAVTLMGLGKAVEHKAEGLKRLLLRRRLLSLLPKRPPLARGLRNHEHRQHSADFDRPVVCA